LEAFLAMPAHDIPTKAVIAGFDAAVRQTRMDAALLDQLDRWAEAGDDILECVLMNARIGGPLRHETGSIRSAQALPV
jgi:hypothetical protein